MSNSDYTPTVSAIPAAVGRFTALLEPEHDADTRRFAARLDRLPPAALADVKLTTALVAKATRLGLFADPRFTGKLAFFRRKIAGRTGTGHGQYWIDQLLNYLCDRVRAR